MPNRKPIDFHNQVLFKQHVDKTTPTWCLLSSCLQNYQIMTNIDTSSLANTVIKKSNVLKFDINIQCNKNMFTFQPNRYYCMIELRDPMNGTMLVTQDGNSLLGKETMCSLTKVSETEFGAQLKVSINKGNRGTKGIFRIQLLDRDDSSNVVEWTTTESFLIQDRNSKKTSTSTTSNNNTCKTEKKRKCTDSSSENEYTTTCKNQSTNDDDDKEAIYAILKSIHPNVKQEEEEESLSSLVAKKKKMKLVTIKSEFDAVAVGVGGGVENVHPNIVANMVTCNNHNHDTTTTNNSSSTTFDFKLLQPCTTTMTAETLCNGGDKAMTSFISTSAFSTIAGNSNFVCNGGGDDISQLFFDNTLAESTPEEGLGQDLWCSDSLSSFFNSFE